MKVPLSEQIQEAEQRRDELTRQGGDQTRLHRAEGIVLTLHLIQATEQDFREFMRQRKTTN